MFGLTADKLVIIAVIAAFLMGPQRLPLLAHRLAGLVKRLRHLEATVRERAREELGDSFDEIEWKRLDPRQYDPRQIVARALSERDS